MTRTNGRALPRLSVYSPQVQAEATRYGITPLQALRKLRAKAILQERARG